MLLIICSLFIIGIILYGSLYLFRWLLQVNGTPTCLHVSSSVLSSKSNCFALFLVAMSFVFFLYYLRSPIDYQMIFFVYCCCTESVADLRVFLPSIIFYLTFFPHIWCMHLYNLLFIKACMGGSSSVSKAAELHAAIQNSIPAQLLLESRYQRH